MLTDKEIFDAVNAAPLGRCGTTTVISVGRAIEAKVLEKLGTSAQASTEKGIPPSCKFCGVEISHPPCELKNALECQNFGYYPSREPQK